MLVEVKNTVTIESILAEAPETIFYSSRSCWWTHDPKDLFILVGGVPVPSAKLLDKSGMPCDPCGVPLFQTDKVADFLNAAQEKKTHYGRYELETFLLAHHKNLTIDGKPWAFESWTAYESILATTKATNSNTFISGQ